MLKRFHSFICGIVPSFGSKSSFKRAVILGRTTMLEEVAFGQDRHCDVISDVPFYSNLTLMMLNVRYVFIPQGY